MAAAAGLRKWPLHIDTGSMLPHGNGHAQGELSAALRLSPARDDAPEPRRISSLPRITDGAGEDKEPAASSNMIATGGRPGFGCCAVSYAAVRDNLASCRSGWGRTG